MRSTDAASLQVCASAADEIPPESLPAALLAQARLFDAFPVSVCANSSSPECEAVREFLGEHPRLFGEKDGVAYTGWHWQELLDRFPDAPEAADARCALARRVSPSAPGDPACAQRGVGPSTVSPPSAFERCKDARLKLGPAGWRGPACAEYLSAAASGACPEHLDGIAQESIATVFAGCEIAARRAGEKGGALLVQLGKLCAQFPYRCERDGCEQYMYERRDLFEDYEISGIQCNTALYEEVIGRWPDSQAADDAAWQKALWYIGECEGFVECYLAVGLRPFTKYRESYPSGRHLDEAVAHLVKTLEGNLDWKPGDERADLLAIKRVLARYESAASDLPARLRSRVLVASEPYWTKLGDQAHAAELRAKVAQLGAE